MPEPNIFSFEDEYGDWLTVQKFDDGSVVFSMSNVGTGMPPLLNAETVKALIAWLQDVSSDDNS